MSDNRPTVYVGGRIPSTASAYNTRPTAIAPLTIRWGRKDAFDAPAPTTATVEIALAPALRLPDSIAVGTYMWITVPRPGVGFAYVFTGTVRDISITAPTDPGGPATATITATDDVSTIKAARLYRLTGGVWRDQPTVNVWPAESALDRIRRVIRAVQPNAAVNPLSSLTPTASKLLAARVRAVGNSDTPNNTNFSAWTLLTEALAAAAHTIHHTPTKTTAADKRDTWTLVPWGEGTYANPLIPAAAVPSNGVRVSTSLGGRIDLIEVVYYPYGESFSGDVEWGLKEQYRSKTLRPSPQSSMRLTTALKADPNGTPTGPDLLISRTTALLERTRWDLTALTPRLTEAKYSTIIDALLTPTTRVQNYITLTGLPQWLGLNTNAQTLTPLGGTLTWDGHHWNATLTLTPRV